MPLDRNEALKLVRKRHDEWKANELRWRWLRESYEAGEVYRRATYGMDLDGLPLQNLVRHKHERPDPGSRGPVNPRTHQVEDRNFWLRQERTPVPDYVSEAIETHLSEIYAREIERETDSAAVRAWWEDVNGAGLEIDDWMVDEVGPYLLALGCVDLLFDRPRVPEGETVRTRADSDRLDLNRVIARIVLPETIVWWERESEGRYRQVLIREHVENRFRYWHWTADEATLYGDSGEVLDTIEHGYGICPIVRVFDRKRPNTEGVGVSRYEAIAEIQKEAYNRESESVLTGALLTHPTIQGPEEFISAEAEMPIGPGFSLAKKRNSTSTGSQYEGWEYLDPPATGAESNRAELERLREKVDRSAKLTKPAGASGMGKGTVSQSGVSKALDQKPGNSLLSRIAKALERAERIAVEFVNQVAGASGESTVSYPKSFNLLSAEELSAILTEIQGIAANGGELPKLEIAGLKGLARLALAGIDGDDLVSIEAEIEDVIASKAAARERENEALRREGNDGRQPNSNSESDGEPGSDGESNADSDA